MSPDDLARALVRHGRASIPYLDRYNPERPLVLECFRPQAHNPDKPVVIVQHGASRNGAEYCEAWIPAAEQHGFLIVAITFPKEACGQFVHRPEESGRAAGDEPGSNLSVRRVGHSARRRWPLGVPAGSGALPPRGPQPSS